MTFTKVFSSTTYAYAQVDSLPSVMLQVVQDGSNYDIELRQTGVSGTLASLARFTDQQDATDALDSYVEAIGDVVEVPT